MSNLVVYKASAGSGKTFRLVAEYIKLVVVDPKSYKRILAVTFTNKATAEMKGRILDELKNLAEGKRTSMLSLIAEETGLDAELIPARAKEALSSILHDYSRFSVSTIDSFVQRIIQALLWEIGQQGGADIRLDYNPVLERAADIMLDESVDNPSLFRWLRLMGEAQIEEGRSWDIRKGLIDLGKELFSESFRLMNHDEISIFTDKEQVNHLKNELNRLVAGISKKVKEDGANTLRTIAESGYGEKNFTQGSKGVYGFFFKCANLDEGDALPGLENSYVKKAYDSPDGEDWVKSEDRKDKSHFAQISGLISSILHPSLVNLYRIINEEQSQYNSARLVLRNLDSLAILGDLWQTIRKLSSDEGFMLLADSGPLLREFVKETDAPFLYEKVGSRYDNFMIDEFQDTSVIQWQNFKPLIENSLSQGGFSMVVGDIKQAIYRWRNGDWRILSSGLEEDFRALGVSYKPLDVNRRSLPAIVEFNNLFFTNASVFLTEMTRSIAEENELGEDFCRQYSLAYDNVLQKSSRINSGKGYVEVNFMMDKEKSFGEMLEERLPFLISDIQKRGFSAGDIAILVRSNKDGQDLANMILSFKQTHPEVYGSFDVVSQEGLLLKSSLAVKLCIAAVRIIYQPNDSITRACFVNELRSIKQNSSTNWHDLFTDDSLSAEFEWMKGFRTRPVQEIFEAVIERYGLLNNKKELAYISELHEQIVNLSRKGINDVGRFIEWWDEDGIELSLTIPESENAITITTIHKSKGLQFPVVIIPYGDWLLSPSNKKPLLWVSAKDKPFNTLPKYPIKNIKDSKKSHFVANSIEEDMQVVVDNLNLLYVALTRAEDECYMFIPNREQKDEKSITRTAHLINKILLGITSDDLKTYAESNEFGEVLKRFYFGIPTNAANLMKSKPDNNIWVLESYPAGETKASIKQRLESTDFFTESQSSIISSINYGKLMHNLFSKIRYANDLDNGLSAMQIEGLIDDNQKKELKEKLESIFSQQPYSNWFSDYWEVKNEISIITPESSTYRPDRVMINGKDVVVVDYKFGAESELYVKQIRRYSNLIKQMGHNNVEGYLWFVDSGKLVKC